ncbi:MAG TPA: mycofactocin biosynthesis glycosyltransferase MftF [Streptosporangiaceae bacterium]|nr:mycofactocin biosynthesis glycosyltransferase MftF [Streptosporangiaceae bacterium]
MRDGPADQLIPAGFRIRADPGARLAGQILTGGAPVRLLRLSAAGARQVTAWWAGEPVSASTAARTLARRLLDAGIAHPMLDGAGAPGPADVTVVVPARDRLPMLAACLASLTGPGQPPVIVADDGSADPAGVAAAAAASGVRLVRRALNGGPGAARNSGFALVSTPFVAFVDSDCVVRPGWLAPLLRHFADPAVGAVAPRIVPHAPAPSWLSRYESASSALDMGPREGAVAAGGRISYLPTAALVVRAAAFGPGFAEDISVGEDVDFVWRLAAAGWRVRYEPGSAVEHQHRDRLRPWFSRRQHYGTSAAVLEARHPRAVRPFYVSRWTAAAWLAAAVGQPAAGAAVTGTATALLARRLTGVTGNRQLAWRLAFRLAAGGTLAAARPLGAAISRAWWPAAIPLAIAVPRLRLPLAALVLTPPLLDWADLRPALDPARFVAGRLLGDVAYSVGLWQGCIRQRTLYPLLPATSTSGSPRSPACQTRS